MNSDTRFSPMLSATQAIHPGLQIPPSFAAFLHAAYHVSTVVFKNLADACAFGSGSTVYRRYGLHVTLTSDTLCQALAQIEGGLHTLLLPSRLAAISLVYSMLIKSGDDVPIPDDAYGPNHGHGEWMARQFSITIRYYDPMIGTGTADPIRHSTKLVWLETPGSVIMEVPDCTATAKMAHKAGAITVVDNTWSGDVYYWSFEYGIDISVQALTEYQSDGNDVLMGAAITGDRALHHRLLATRMRIGWGIPVNDCRFVLRGLPSLPTRLAAYDAYAREMAEWLAGQPGVVCALHPTPPDCPGHENWKRDFTGASGLFSIMLHEHYSRAQIDAFIEDLRYSTIGFPQGGTHSLTLPYSIPSMHTATVWPPADWENVSSFVRLYIGLEDPRDLIVDLKQATETHLGA